MAGNSLGMPLRSVLFISSSGSLAGGAEGCLCDLAAEFVSRGIRVLVAAPFEGDMCTTLRAMGATVTVGELGVPRNRKEAISGRVLLRAVGSIPTLWRIIRMARAAEVELVHTNTSIVVVGAVVAKVLDVPHAWHIRELLTGFRWRLLARLIARADKILCISQSVLENVCRRDAAMTAKAVVIRDAVSPQMISTHIGRAKRSHGIRTVGMAARINPWKGHRLFLEMARSLAERNSGVRFEIAGGSLKAYEELAAQLMRFVEDCRMTDLVTFLGAVPRDEMSVVMSSWDVVVMPSTSPEPGGLVILEAMAIGVPVVATTGGGPSEVITSGRDGLLAAAEPDALAAAVQLLLDDEKLRTNLGSAAQVRARAEFGITKQVDQLVKIYREMLTARTSQGRRTPV